MTVNWAALADPEIIVRLILQVALFMGSALFSSSETALFSLRSGDFEKMRRAGQTRDADRLTALLDEPRQLIVSILCGNELINIAATINLAGIFLTLFGDPATASLMNTAVMLPLLLLFGEITPKSLAVAQPATLSRRIIGPAMTIWVRLVAPLRAVVRAVSDRLTTALVGEARGGDNILSADEFSAVLGEAEEEGAVTAAERRLIGHLIEASATRITAIMTPRPQVHYLKAEMTPQEMIEEFRTMRHRRMPVYRGLRDNITGVVREERVIALLERKRPEDITHDELIEPAQFAPETLTVADLAEFLKDGVHHSVIAVNEFGGVEGMVTTDDVFTFLTRGQRINVAPGEQIREEGDGWICRGLTPISSARAATGLPLELDAGAHTVGGLVMALLKRMPEVGDCVEDGEAELEVLEMSGRVIESLRIDRRDGDAEEAA